MNRKVFLTMKGIEGLQYKKYTDLKVKTYYP